MKRRHAVSPQRISSKNIFQSSKGKTSHFQRKTVHRIPNGIKRHRESKIEKGKKEFRSEVGQRKGRISGRHHQVLKKRKKELSMESLPQRVAAHEGSSGNPSCIHESLLTAQGGEEWDEYSTNLVSPWTISHV